MPRHSNHISSCLPLVLKVDWKYISCNLMAHGKVLMVLFILKTNEFGCRMCPESYEKQKCLPKFWSWNPRWFVSAESFLPLIIWNISLKHLSQTNKEKEIPLTEPLIEAEWKYIILRRFQEKPEIQQHWKDFSLLP